MRSRRKRGGNHEGHTGGHVEDDEPRARVRCGYVGTDGEDDERHQDENRREPRCGISDPVGDLGSHAAIVTSADRQGQKG